MSFVAVELANLLNEKYHIGDDPTEIAATEGLHLIGSIKQPPETARKLYTGNGCFVIFYWAWRKFEDVTKAQMAAIIREEFAGFGLELEDFRL